MVRLQRHHGGCHRGQVDDRDGVRVGAIDGAGIEDEGFAFQVVFRDVGVAVADEVKFAGLDGLAKTARVVTVKEGDFSAGQRDVAEAAVAGVSGGLDGRAEDYFVAIDVAEDVVRRPGAEEFGNLRGADITTMKHDLRGKAFEHSHGRSREFHLPVGITDDSDQHFVVPPESMVPD